MGSYCDKIRDIKYPQQSLPPTQSYPVVTPSMKPPSKKFADIAQEVNKKTRKVSRNDSKKNPIVTKTDSDKNPDLSSTSNKSLSQTKFLSIDTEEDREKQRSAKSSPRNPHKQKDASKKDSNKKTREKSKNREPSTKRVSSSDSKSVLSQDSSRKHCKDGACNKSSPSKKSVKCKESPSTAETKEKENCVLS